MSREEGSMTSKGGQVPMRPKHEGESENESNQNEDEDEDEGDYELSQQEVGDMETEEGNGSEDNEEVDNKNRSIKD